MQPVSSSSSDCVPLTWFGNSHAIGTNVPEQLGFMLVDRQLEGLGALGSWEYLPRLRDMLHLFPKADPKSMARAPDREARVALHSKATEALWVRYFKGNSERVGRLIGYFGMVEKTVPPFCLRVLQQVAPTIRKLKITYDCAVIRELLAQAPFTEVEELHSNAAKNGFDYTQFSKLKKCTVQVWKNFDQIAPIPASVTSQDFTLDNSVTLSGFFRCSALQELSLTTENGAFADKDPFQALLPLAGSLTSLTMKVTWPRDLPRSYTKLSLFTRLTHVAIKAAYRDLTHDDPVRDFSFLRSLPLLETIDLATERLHDDDIAMLADHKRLRQVKICGNISSSIYPILATLPELELFSHTRGWNSYIEVGKVKLLAANRKLTHVTLASHLQKEVYDELACLTQVTDLVVHHFNSPLPPMANLRTLQITGNPLEAGVVGSLVAQPQLQQLQVPHGFFTHCREAGEQHLLKMKRLKVLGYTFRDANKEAVERELPDTQVVSSLPEEDARFF